MTSIGVRKIWFVGSEGYFERLVCKHSDGTFWCRWYHRDIQIRQINDDESASDGWRTVKAY